VRQKIEGVAKNPPNPAVFFLGLARRGEIDNIVLCRDPTCEGEDWPHTGWKFCDDDSERLRLAFERPDRLPRRIHSRQARRCEQNRSGRSGHPPRLGPSMTQPAPHCSLARRSVSFRRVARARHLCGTTSSPRPTLVRVVTALVPLAVGSLRTCWLDSSMRTRNRSVGPATDGIRKPRLATC
jgi:hypothetical protein